MGRELCDVEQADDLINKARKKPKSLESARQLDEAEKILKKLLPSQETRRLADAIASIRRQSNAMR
jgi:hypothetical protein